MHRSTNGREPLASRARRLVAGLERLWLVEQPRAPAVFYRSGRDLLRGREADARVAAAACTVYRLISLDSPTAARLKRDDAGGQIELLCGHAAGLIEGCSEAVEEVGLLRTILIRLEAQSERRAAVVDALCRYAGFLHLLGRFGEAAGVLDQCGRWVGPEADSATTEYVLAVADLLLATSSSRQLIDVLSATADLRARIAGAVVACRTGAPKAASTNLAAVRTELSAGASPGLAAALALGEAELAAYRRASTRAVERLASALSGVPFEGGWRLALASGELLEVMGLGEEAARAYRLACQHAPLAAGRWAAQARAFELAVARDDRTGAASSAVELDALTERFGGDERLDWMLALHDAHRKLQESFSRLPVQQAEMAILHLDYPAPWDRSPWWRPPEQRWPMANAAHPAPAPWARTALRASLDHIEAGGTVIAFVP